MAAHRSEAAPAKLNLYLHVIGRRDDGYHLLDSLVAFAEIGDRVTAEPADELSLRVEGPFAPVLPTGPDNLVLRAARALAEASGAKAGARLTLEKNLPVASGLGGGSSDAAATLRLLCRQWGTAAHPADLVRVAVTLGADVPVCLNNRAARMSGIGERLAEAPELPPCGIVVANPGVGVATADIFRARRGLWSEPAALPSGWRTAEAMASDLAALRNDLEPAAIGLYPVIAEVLSVLCRAPGSLLARMSGSGASCFGLFADEAIARTALSHVRRPGWWCWAGTLRDA